MPLVSQLSEIKMLKRLQDQINHRTVLLASQTASKTATPAQIENQHRRLAQSQRDVETLARQINQDLQKGGM